MGKYVIKETATGIKFDLKATNGIMWHLFLAADQFRFCFITDIL